MAALSAELFPLANDMATLVQYVVTWVVYGIGLSIVFWTLGYLVWFVIQFLR